MILQHKTKHIFFDLDHTLWDFDKNSEIAFNTIFSKYHPKIVPKQFIEVYIPINQDCWKLYQENKISHNELRYNRLKYSFDAIAYKISDPEIHFISEEYLRLLPKNNHLFDGAIEILEYLQPNYDLHIITNGFANVQEQKMINSGLKVFFKTITNSETAGVKKPNSQIFDYAFQKANAKKHNSIMIGDSWEADIVGAINFGCEAIFFNISKTNSQNEVIEIEHLLQLKEYF